jgi:hypothetical protein
MSISIPSDTLYVLIRNAAYEQERDATRFFRRAACERPLIAVAVFFSVAPILAR